MHSVREWLDDLGLGQYAPAFEENDVDAEILVDLSDQDLEKLGIASLGHRKKILRAIVQLAAANEATADEKERPRTGAEERRQLTVMFADLVGSTELSEGLDPEVYREVIRSFHDTAARTIESHGGHIAKSLGDGLLAYFGYPFAREDDPERAVYAGLELTGAMDEIAVPADEHLALRTGIATGRVVVGDLIGERMTDADAALGNVPNLAARLQALAAPGTVIVSDGTHQITAGVFGYEDLGERWSKGLSRPVQVWRVLSAKAVESRFEARHDNRLTPLVGRDEEVMLLARRWQRAKEGEGQVVLVSGEPGIGKSRLCETLRERAAGQVHARLTFQCSPQHSSSALYPVIRHVERAAGLEPHDQPTEKLDKLKALLGSQSREATQDALLLASLLSVPLPDRDAPASLDALQSKEQMLRALTRQIASLTGGGPVLLLLEDYHWADPSTKELMSRLVEEAEFLPILMFITSRSEIGVSWKGLAHVSAMTLNRMSRRTCRAMVAELAGPKQPSEDLVADIVARTDGIPLFIEELARTVFEGGGDQPTHRVPAALQDLLMARLDQLNTGRQVAQTGAAIGREFTQEILAAVSALGTQELGDGLDELVASGLASRRGSGALSTYRFKHALIQDAAYSSLLKTVRTSLHRRIAETLEAASEALPGDLAHQWEGAADLEKALAYRLQAGERAAEQYARWESVAEYWRALHLLDRLPDNAETRRRHIETLLSVLGVEGGYFWRDETERTKAREHVEKALEAAHELNDPSSWVRLLAYKGSAGHALDPDGEKLGTSEALLMRAADEAASLGNKQLEAEVTHRLGSHLGRIGRFEESLAYLERAVSTYEELGLTARLGRALAGNARCYSARAGRLDTSIEIAERVRAIVETTEDHGLRAWTTMAAEPFMYRGSGSRR